MKRIALILCALTASAGAYAQSPPPGPPPPGGRVPPIERLATELNLTDNQKSEVQRIFDIAGFSIPYQVFASRDEAVKAL